MERGKETTGVIIRLLGRRGYGFLRCDDGSDVYFHVSGCLVPWKSLREGMEVSFAMTVDDPRTGRPKAIGVTPIAVIPDSDEVGTADK